MNNFFLSSSINMLGNSTTIHLKAVKFLLAEKIALNQVNDIFKNFEQTSEPMTGGFKIKLMNAVSTLI